MHAIVEDKRRLTLLWLQLLVLLMLTVWDSFDSMYVRIFWWDVVSHLLGGMWLALCYACIAQYLHIRLSVWACVAAALFGGSLWEGYEYLADMIYSPFMSYEVDTVKDLIIDVIGGWIAGYIAIRVGVVQRS